MENHKKLTGIISQNNEDRIIVIENKKKLQWEILDEKKLTESSRLAFWV